MLKEAFRNNEANSRSYETRVFVVFRRGLCVWRVGGTPWGGPLGCGPGPLMCVYTEGELSGSFCCGWFLLVF